MALHIALEVVRDSSVSLTSQIQEFIRREIAEGTLHPGTRLPSSRRLAGDLDVSRSVVVEAYGQLVAEGYLETAHGSGTKVVGHLDTGPVVPALLDEQKAGQKAEPVRWDLRPGGGNTPAFPRSEWLRCYQRVLQAADLPLHRYPPLAGEGALRHELSRYLGRVRGVRARPGQIAVVAGFAEALGLLCTVLPGLGIDTLAIEDPGHPGQRQFIRETGLGVLPVAVDGEGVDVEALARSGARAVLVTATHQFPTGATLSERRRAALARWAEAVDGWVIEDDYDGGLWYERGTRPLALQRSMPDRVVYAGTASKALSPSLRLGWLTAPAPMLELLLRARARHDLGTDAFTQLTMAEMLRTGLFDRHLRRLNVLAHSRRDTLDEAVRRHLPGASVSGARAGLHAYVRLPRPTDEAALVAAVLRGSVLVRGSAAFHMRPQPDAPALVVGHAHLPGSGITDALRTVGAVRRG
ncbi:PLP-dependent aminotransferase family protein [Streptomyces aurantiacus]|uniref:Putative HTH-type pyridoxine biosynthesis transcriptional regulator PdxR n=1 Tax=Streptomyces aurantiacus JA 4570 TaxID=1286094 RepID=S4AT20_9ACTN|nr:PLP-dependent aminotransferase family protein [Streptomyces aurantiacus]EPH44547.1 putative HTH-type pyridoxine biosynthesis transcriptional regulator PdxR [Streptomyces aurantiacus JA 4570]